MAHRVTGWRRVWRAVRYPLLGFGVAVPVGLYEAYTFRARSSVDVDFHESMRGVDRLPDNALDRWLYWLTMSAELGFVSSVFIALMGACHEVEILEHDKLLQPLRKCVLMGGCAPPGVVSARRVVSAAVRRAGGLFGERAVHGSAAGEGRARLHRRRR